MDQASDGSYYLVIHSGSRNLGKQVAEIYQQLAIDLHTGKEKYFLRREEIIRTYKAQGRSMEIQNALKALEKEYTVKSQKFPAISAGCTVLFWMIISMTLISASVLPAETEKEWQKSFWRKQA